MPRIVVSNEREAIERVLFQAGWNRKQAARLLGVRYKTLLQTSRECGLEPEAPGPTAGGLAGPRER